jgi:hypothetical protein
MTRTTRFDRLSKVGRYAAVLGLVAIGGGMCLGKPLVIGAGVLILSFAAYVMAFVVAKSF